MLPGRTVPLAAAQPEDGGGPEPDHVEAVLPVISLGQLLDEELRGPVQGRGDRRRRFVVLLIVQREAVPVGGDGGGIDHAPRAAQPSRLEDVRRSGAIDLNRAEGTRLAVGGEQKGEVHHAVDAVTVHRLDHFGGLGDVAPHQRHALRHVGDPPEVERRIEEDDVGLAVDVEQITRQMRAEEPRPASDQYRHGLSFRVMPLWSSR